MLNLETKDHTFKGQIGACMEFDTKMLAGDGMFEGFASVYGNVDEGDEIIQSGAFTDSLRRRPIERVKMLLHHDTRKPVGVWAEAKSDQQGLFVRGQLLLNIQAGVETHELMKAGALDGLSIGFKTIDDSWEGNKWEGGIRTITKANLMEVSIVTFPMNEAATVSAVKSVESIKTIRDFERHLRDVGFSVNAAKGIALNGFKQSDLRDVADDQQSVVDALHKLSCQMRG